VAGAWTKGTHSLSDLLCVGLLVPTLLVIYRGYRGLPFAGPSLRLPQTLEGCLLLRSQGLSEGGWAAVTAPAQRGPGTLFLANHRPWHSRTCLRFLWPLDLRRGYATSCPPNQVNDSKKGSNGAAGSRSGNLHSERGVFGVSLVGWAFPPVSVGAN